MNLNNYIDWSISNWERSDISNILTSIAGLIKDSDFDAFSTRVLPTLLKYCRNTDAQMLMEITKLSSEFQLKSEEIPTVERIASQMIASNNKVENVIFGLLFEFKYGIGPEIREFGENSILIDDIKDFYLVEEGRIFFL